MLALSKGQEASIPLLNIVGVAEVYCRINSDNQHAWHLCCFWILIYISVNIRPWELTKYCGPGPSYLQEDFDQGDGYLFDRAEISRYRCANQI